MLARPKQGRGDREPFMALQRLDRRAGGDLAVERDFDRVVGRGSDDRPRRKNRSPGSADLGHLDHFERARAVGQAADELAFLQGRNEPMNPRLGLQVERLAHLVETGADAGLLEALVDELEEFALLDGEHRILVPLGSIRNERRTCIERSAPGQAQTERNALSKAWPCCEPMLSG